MKSEGGEKYGLRKCGSDWGKEGEQGSLLQKQIRMSFLSSIKKVLNIGQTEKKRKLILQNIKVCTLNTFTSSSVMHSENYYNLDDEEKMLWL